MAFLWKLSGLQVMKTSVFNVKGNEPPRLATNYNSMFVFASGFIYEDMICRDNLLKGSSKLILHRLQIFLSLFDFWAIKWLI